MKHKNDRLLSNVHTATDQLYYGRPPIFIKIKRGKIIFTSAPIIRNAIPMLESMLEP